MSDLLTILQEIQDKAYGWRGENEVFIQAIIADGRIGVLPTKWQLSASLQGGCGFQPDIANRIADNLIAEGWARADPQEEAMLAHIDDRIAEAREAIERKYSPDQDSAAVTAIATVIRKRVPVIGTANAEYIARGVLAHLREHPEDVGIPVMTASEAMRHITAGNSLPVPHIVIPDPPPAEPVPSVEPIEWTIGAVEDYALLWHQWREGKVSTQTMEGARKNYTDKLTRLVEAAQGRADDGA